MPYAASRDNVRLYFEEAGSGTPILFVHEFAADYASWEPQMRYFSRGHRCICYSARGYTPSDVPTSDSSYTHEHFRDDAIAILDHLKIKAAHLVGLSMGAYSSLQVGISAPDRALSLTLAGIGSGFEASKLDQFRAECRSNAEQLEKSGTDAFANTYGRSAGRIAFEVKDPRGYQEFFEALSRHDAKGSAFTMRNFQGGRPPLYEFEAAIRRVTRPTLIIVGDEDDACIESSLYLKKHIAPSGLAMFPKTGHVLNLEEPALFNGMVERFIALAEAGRWTPRDPRSIKA
ncbi:MAG TPA: alpha/beta hydrolase [Nitrobacter sp.]|jgi:proline iminopeptidase|nr:alpha/beta hydrolase [Nitrobacter sp.]